MVICLGQRISPNLFIFHQYMQNLSLYQVFRDKSMFLEKNSVNIQFSDFYLQWISIVIGKNWKLIFTDYSQNTPQRVIFCIYWWKMNPFGLILCPKISLKKITLLLIVILAISHFFYKNAVWSLKIPAINSLFWILVYIIAIHHCAKEQLA